MTARRQREPTLAVPLEKELHLPTVCHQLSLSALLSLVILFLIICDVPFYKFLHLPCFAPGTVLGILAFYYCVLLSIFPCYISYFGYLFFFLSRSPNKLHLILCWSVFNSLLVIFISICLLQSLNFVINFPALSKLFSLAFFIHLQVLGSR